MAFLGVADPLSYVAMGVIVAAVLYSWWRKALLTFPITVACVVIYALEVVSENGILFDLALYHVPPPFAAYSPPWTWVTYQFLHFGVSHLLFNILALMLIAPPFEDRIGSLRFGVLYFVGGIVGGLGFLLFYFNQATALVGASASISAIFGGYGRLYPRERIQLFFPIPGLPAFRVIDVVVGFLVLETAFSVLGGFFGPLSGIAWIAHVIAMALGFAIAPLVMRIPSRRHRPHKKVSFASWQTFATTPELREILEEAQRADIPEIREAWMEKFVAAMRCPKCGGPVKKSLGRLTSSCGWKGRVP